MEKKLIRKTVFVKYFNKQQPKWKDVKDAFELQDEHLVRLNYDEDDEWLFEVEAEELESDEQYNKRLERNQRWIEKEKERKYELFLKLKEEFEK
jgi:hypothetical protein